MLRLIEKKYDFCRKEKIFKHPGTNNGRGDDKNTQRPTKVHTFFLSSDKSTHDTKPTTKVHIFINLRQEYTRLEKRRQKYTRVQMCDKSTHEQ